MAFNIQCLFQWWLARLAINEKKIESLRKIIDSTRIARYCPLQCNLRARSSSVSGLQRRRYSRVNWLPLRFVSVRNVRRPYTGCPICWLISVLLYIINIICIVKISLHFPLNILAPNSYQHKVNWKFTARKDSHCIFSFSISLPRERVGASSKSLIETLIKKNHHSSRENSAKTSSIIINTIVVFLH